MILYPNSGLQPRIAPVCTGASAGSSSTRCRRRPRRFRRRRLWCRARLFHFNRVPEKLPEKVWEALVQSQVRFNRVSEKGSGEGFRRRVPEKVPEKVWEALVQSQVRFNRIPEKGSGEGAGGAEPG